MCAEKLLVSVLLLAAVQAIQSSAYDALCPIDANPASRTLLAHPGDCSKFLVCFNGDAYVRPCPANLYWNQERQGCDFAGKLQCKVMPTLSMECVDGNFYAVDGSCEKYYYCQGGRKVARTCAAGFHWHQKQRHCVAPHKSHCQQSVIKEWRNGDAYAACPAKNAPAHQVNLPFAGDCSLFLKCANGRAWVMECPVGLLWNAERDQCDYAYRTKCASPVKDIIDIFKNDSTNLITGESDTRATYTEQHKVEDLVNTAINNTGYKVEQAQDSTLIFDTVMQDIAPSGSLTHSTDNKSLKDNDLNSLRNTESSQESTSTTISEKLEGISEPVESHTSAGSEIRTTSSDTFIHSTLAIEPVVAQSHQEHKNMVPASTTGPPTSTAKRARFTQDPHLPYRAPQCLDDKSRVKFAASNNQQFYQCFEGLAYLLNCHGGFVFSPLASKCIAGAAIGCK